MGIIYSILSALFFGLYTLPKKRSHLPPFMYSILMSFGFTITAAIIYIIYLCLGNNFDLFNPNLQYSIIAGILWGIAFTLLIKSIDKIGVVRSNQWKNLQGPVGVVLNLVLLGEASKVNPFLAVLSGILIFFSAFIFNLKSNVASKTKNRGVIFAVISGVLFGIVSLINNYVIKTAGVYNQELIWAVSIMVTLVFIALVQKKFTFKKLGSLKEIYLAGFSGILYFGASVFLLLAFQNLESSIAFNIIQLNFLVVVGFGAFFFKEYNVRIHWKILTLGTILANLGILVLSFARG
jgi:drug/metabolite transporter (DMT)-like permease